MALKIYTQSGVHKATVSPSDNSTHQTAIMAENVLNLSFTLPEYLPLEVNDYTVFEGEKFELLEYYQPVKKSSIEYDYSPKFYGIIARLKNALVLNMTDGANESSFSLTADASAHLQFVLDNINRITGLKVWISGEIKATGNKTIVYDCVSCFDALNKIAEEFEVEWWIEGTTIHLSRCEHGDPIELGYRKGLLSITKSDNENAKFFTRLYPIGSSRNIDKKKYGYSRLRLPNGVQYMEHNTHLGIVEFSEEAAFSHIYPRRIGKVGTVRTEEKIGENGEPFTIYYFTDPQMPFDPNDYEIEGLVKSIVFQTGELSGYDFEVNFDSKTKEFEIITQFPTDDSQLPNRVLCPAFGNEYILYDINMPESYYTDAEYELKGAVEEYIQKYSVDVSVYKSPTDYIYFTKNKIDLRLGRRIRLLSDEYFTGGNHDTRVTSITRKINNPMSMDIECSYSVAAGRISQIESNVVDIQTQFKEQISKTALQVLKSWDSVDPSEYNVLSSVRTLRAISNSLKKLAEENDLKYLRKDIADSAKELITFLNGIDVIGEALIDRLIVDNGAMFRDILSSEEFISGFPAGKGWAILWKEVLNAAGVKERKAVMELDEVTVRGVMRIYEMIISQQRGENGTRLTSDQMHVHSIDPEQRKIYLDTEKGVLYNPFRSGDILMVQQYQGMPTAENGYSVTKQYELAVVDAGIGALSDKEERLDWITYKSFVGDISSVAARDVLTRVDSLTNLDRKGIIKQTSVEEGAPYLDVIYGMKTDPDNAVRTRLGRLSGIVNYWWGQLQGYGLYSENAYLLGDFRLRTGDNVQTLFEMVEGMLRSAMQTMTYTLTEEDNFLTNAAFTRDMECWIHDSNIVFFEADGELINTGNNFMTEKNTIAEVVEFDGRQMLRILDSEIIQLNEYIRKPEEDSVIYLSFRYMCEESGTLKVGFDGTDEESDFTIKEYKLSKNTEYKVFEVSGLWDGEGDFTLSFSGDIYIDLLTLANKPLEDYKKTVSTLFEQTDEYIKAVATEINNLDKYVKEAGWITTADGHKLWATHETVNGIGERLTTHEGSFHVTAEYISGMVKRIDTAEDKLGIIDKTISSAGWITTADGNKLWATIERVDLLGNRLTTHESSFHVTATEINGIVSRVDTVENRIKTAGWITTADGNKLWATQETLNALTKEYNNFKSEISQQADTISLAVKKGTGTMLYKDLEFKEGLNSVKVYSNSTTKTTVERVNKSSDCPTGSSWMLKLAFTYGTEISPGLGGFYFGNVTRANAVFETHILAKIPVGYTINLGTNAYGTGSSYKWLTSNEGTGKWETYICRVQCGTSGTFSSTNFYYLNGTKPTVQYSTNGTTWYSYYVAGATYFRIQNANGTWGSTVNLTSSPDYNKLIWYVGSATVYDLSQYEDVVSQINLSPHEVKIKADRINLEGYVTATNISTINITTSRLTVLSGAKIGNFTVQSDTLYWNSGNAKIRLGYASVYNNASIFAQADYYGHAIVGICNNGGAAIYGSCRAYPTYPSTSVLWAGFFDGNVNVRNANLFCEDGVVQAKEVYSLNGWSGSFKGKSVRVKWGIITEVW